MLVIVASAGIAGPSATISTLARAQSPPAARHDDAEAQLRIRQAGSAVTAATSEVEQLTAALQAERKRVVQTSDERELNQATISDLEKKLVRANAALQEKQLALKAAQEARVRGLEVDTQRQRVLAPAPAAATPAAPPQRTPAAAAPQPKPETAKPAKEMPWAVLQRMGVGGTWAAVCAEDVGDSNWFHTYYADKSGAARRRADRGSALSSLNSTIDSSQYLTPTTFLMRMRNDDAGWGDNNQVAYDVIAEIGPRGMRSLSSTRTSDGKQFIKDGKFTANGNPVRAFHKCK